eukprot:m.32297 g.32297  ORF g.32297 m.32297 type:complete len:474 (+) comp31620_c0_seq1:34-1455(+)
MAVVQDPSTRIRQLSSKASVVLVDHSVPVKRYYRTGVEMERVANMYHSEGNLEHAFFLYSKFITLYVEKLPKHPDFSQITKEERKKRKQTMKVVFDKAEEVKGKLTEKYAKEYDNWLAAEKKKKAVEEERRMREEEEERRRLEKEREEQERRRLEMEEMAKRQQEKEVEEESKERPVESDSITVLPPPPPPSYNEATESNEFTLPNATAMVPEYGGGAYTPSLEEGMAGLSVREPSAPAMFPTGDLAYSQGLPIPNIDRSTKPEPPVLASMPSFDRSLKPDRLNSVTSLGDLDLENTVDGLRRIIVPGDLMNEFERSAMMNTLRNVETCGILAGKLKGKAFYITHVLIPKQEGTTESCETLNEEDLFEYQDNHDLITLGWIHTHPTQTSFLSSVDLHTHCGYQLMMDEAIAIVCAPKHKQTGIFNLTRPYGINFISSCKKGGFHPHPREPKLFQDCGHVTIESFSPVIIRDFR